MAECRENLELVSVEYEDGGSKAVMTFLDTERKEIRQVSWNKKVYENGKYVDNDEKAEKVENWASEYFNTTFDNLTSCIGQKKNVYVYDRYNSLFEVSEVSKFNESMKGDIYQTEIKEVEVGPYAIKIRYDIEGKTYESKHSFGEYIESLKEWFVNPQKKVNVYNKFGTGRT